MQSVERNFQEFRRWAGHDLDAVVAQYRAEATALGEDPDRVILSQRGLLRYLEGQRAMSGSAGVMRRASELQGWLAYRSTKTIIAIDERLGEKLCAAKWPLGTANSVVSLPINGAVLRFCLPGDDAPTDFILFYDYGIECELLLRVARVRAGVLAPCGTLRLDGAQREAGLDQRFEDAPFIRTRSEREKDVQLAQYLTRELPGYREASSGRGRIMQHVLNILLYLNGNDPAARRVLRAVDNRRKARARSPGGNDRRPHLIFAGKVSPSRAKEGSLADGMQTAADAARRSIRPHQRRAHQRVFWTGEGRKIARVRMVRATVVHGGPDEARPAGRARR